MKKGVIGCVLIFLCFTSLTSLGDREGRDGMLELIEGEAVTFEGVELTLRYEPGANKSVPVYAAHADLKPGYELFKPVRVYRKTRDGGFPQVDGPAVLFQNERGEIVQLTADRIIYPLINLDIFGMQNDQRVAIEEMKASVTVTFTSDFFERNKIPAADRGPEFSVFDQKTSEWVSLRTRSRSWSDVRTGGESPLAFTIHEWPVDDKMICSGP